MKRLVIVVTTVALIAAMVGCGQPTPPEEAVTFADPNLEAAIREAIDKPTAPIYPSDLGQLESFWAPNPLNRIVNLEGLEYCTSLTELALGYNEISDISALTNLTSLTKLYLDNNQISDISPLANLRNLTSLELDCNSISDISPLADLISLTGLGLGANQISDVSPLVDNEGLSDGDQVYLTGNPLSSDSVNIYIPQLEARGVVVDY